MDKRIVNTKNKIYAAFSGLISQKGIGDISVSELCRIAGINRNTFYAYFSNVNDIMVEIVHNTENDAEEFITAYITEEKALKDTIKSMFDYYVNSKILHDIMKNPEVRSNFFNIISDFINSSFSDFLVKKYPQYNENSIREAVTFILGGVISAAFHSPYQANSENTIVFADHISKVAGIVFQAYIDEK